jgi:hypothetical protein
MAGFIEFHYQGMSESGKTEIYAVCTKNGTQLGIIHWYGAFRHYCFSPNPNTIYDSGCLKEISSQLDTMMLARKH